VPLGVVVAAHGCLHQAGGADGQRRPVRLVLAAELLKGGQHLPQGAVEVADDRRGPRHGQLGHRPQERLVDPRQQRFQALAGRQHRRVVAHLVGGHQRRPGQFGAGLRV
jgi:hypothetical protein